MNSKLIALVGVMLLVMFLFIYVSTNKINVLSVLSAHTTASAPHATSVPFETRVVNLILQDGRLIGGPTALKLFQGEMVVFEIKSNRNELFTLSGYNKAVQLYKNQTVVLSFLTTLPGSFNYSLNNTAYLGNMTIAQR